MAQAAKTVGSMGMKKAAVLLVSIDSEVASRLMSQLDAPTIEAVSQAIAQLGTISPDERNKVVEEFYQLNMARQYVQQGGIDYARKLLSQSLTGAQADSVLKNVEHALYSVPFTFARKAESQNLLSFIQDEHPQTVALILSHLESQQAADVLKGLPSAKQVDVVRRMATMETTDPEVVREVEASLEKRMSSVVTQKLEQSGGVETVAAILNLTDRATETVILETLQEESPELVDEIRKRMFVFEDVMLVSDRGIQRLLREINTEDLSLALKTASDELKEKIFRNMSERAVTLLKEDMEYLGPVRLSEVEATQQKIADVVRRLEEGGELIIQGRGKEEVIV